MPLLRDDDGLRQKLYDNFKLSHPLSASEIKNDEELSAFHLALFLGIRSLETWKAIILREKRSKGSSAKCELYLKKQILKTTTRTTPSRAFSTVSTISVSNTTYLNVSSPKDAQITLIPSDTFLSKQEGLEPQSKESIHYKLGECEYELSFDGHNYISRPVVESKSHSSDTWKSELDLSQTYRENVAFQRYLSSIFTSTERSIATSEPTRLETLAIPKAIPPSPPDLMYAIAKRSGQNLSISGKIVSRVLEANDVLIEKTLRANPNYSALHSAIVKRFGHEFTPLVEVFSEDSGVLLELEHQKSRVNNEPSVRDRELTEFLALQLLRPNCESINLSLLKATEDRQLAKKSQLGAIDSGSVIFRVYPKVVGDEDAAIIEIADSGPGLGSEMISRFATGSDSESQLVKKIGDFHLKRESFDVPVELVYNPFPFAQRELCLRPKVFNFHLALSTDVKIENSIKLNIDDILIRADLDQIHAYSKTLQKKLSLFVNSAHNFHMPIFHNWYRWLPILSKRFVYGFYWPRAFRCLPRLPQVVVDGVVCQPEQFNLDAIDPDRKTSITRVLDFLKSTGKTSFKVGANDKFLPFSITDAFQLSVVEDEIKRPDNIIITDVGACAGRFVSDSEGRYRSEFVVPFFRSPIEPSIPIETELPFLDLVTPEEEALCVARWIYLEWDCNPEAVRGLLQDFIVPVLNELLDSKLIECWYFLRYNDPSNHLRFRAKATTSESWATALELLLKLSGAAARERRIMEWRQKPYRPEYARYGGKRGVPIAEKIFHESSSLVGKYITLSENESVEVQQQTENALCYKYFLSLLKRASWTSEVTVSFIDQSIEASGRNDFGVALANARYLAHKIKEDVLSIEKKENYSALFLEIETVAGDHTPAWELVKAAGQSVVCSLHHMMCNRTMESWNVERELAIIVAAKGMFLRH